MLVASESNPEALYNDIRTEFGKVLILAFSMKNVNKLVTQSNDILFHQ